MNLAKRQMGAALFVGMVFLLVLTILALTAAKVSTLDERMAGNYLRREQATQHVEEAQSDAARFVTLCKLGPCPQVPSSVKPDPTTGTAVWTHVGLARDGGTERDERELITYITAQSASAISAIANGTSVDHVKGTIMTSLDVQAGLASLEAGTAQTDDYYRITSIARKGDLSGSADARSTDVMRQMIFVP